MKTEMIQKYAHLLLQFGVALQKGQRLVVEIPEEQRELADALRQAAVEMGGRDTAVFYRNDREDAACMKQHPDIICQKTEREKRALQEALEGNAVSLAFLSPDPLLDQELDDEQKAVFANYRNELRNVVRKAIRERHIQWCYACVPNREWAKWLFPDLEAEEAEEKLWDIIADICLLKEENPLEAWLEKYDRLYRYTEILNGLSLKKIHFFNHRGTDLEVGVNPKCIWEGGIARDTYTPSYYQCNLPSYEICTTTDRLRTNGRVYASKPLYVNGGVIEDFWLEFREGRVVSFEAGKGAHLLEEILKADEGSSYLGEVAFVEIDSPIARTGLVFLNTLLDENASCHLALGEGFPGNIRGIDPSDAEAVRKNGVNRSGQHVDFMFGTDDLCAVGYTVDGREIQIFENGKYSLC